MVRVTSEILVTRSADEVFAFIADAENNPRWQRGMRSCRWVTPGPIGVGSTYTQRARFLGRDIASTFEVTDLQPGRSISIRTIESTFPIEVTRSAVPIGDDRTRVNAVVVGDPTGVFRIATPVLRRMVQRSVRADYRRLQRLLDRAEP
jgi:uncharacterized membrane protein